MSGVGRGQAVRGVDFDRSFLAYRTQDGENHGRFQICATCSMPGSEEQDLHFLTHPVAACTVYGKGELFKRPAYLFQVETGPVVLPDPNGPPGDGRMLSLCYFAFSGLDRAEAMMMPDAAIRQLRCTIELFRSGTPLADETTVKEDAT